MKRDGQDRGEQPVEQVDDDDTGTAQIHDVPKKRHTIAGFQAPLPPTDVADLYRQTETFQTPNTLAESWPIEEGPLPDGPGPSDSMGTSTAARYTLGPILGRGGMGEVFSAHDESSMRSASGP